VPFSRILDALPDILNCENEVLKFDRDIAIWRDEFEDLHAESKPSSESLNLIFSSSFFDVMFFFIALNFCYLLLKMHV
jgi:hypothetical protein